MLLRNVAGQYNVCTPDVEVLSISFRSFYLPRECSTIVAVLVYVPPSANYSVAAETITQYMHKLDNVSPSAPKLLFGDSNGCSLQTYIPTYREYVLLVRHVPTQRLFCATVTSRTCTNLSQKPPLGTSDHASKLPADASKVSRRRDYFILDASSSRVGYAADATRNPSFYCMLPV